MKKLLIIVFIVLVNSVGFAGFIESYKGDHNINQYPTIEGSKLIIVCAKFTDEFVSKYRYEDSENYRFALTVKVDGIGGYYNVFRNKNKGVSNDFKRGLDGAKPAYYFKSGFCYVIPLDTEINIATEEYQKGLQYKKVKLPTEGKLELYLSSTKELKGWELANIYYYVWK